LRYSAIASQSYIGPNDRRSRGANGHDKSKQDILVLVYKANAHM
jgi:hypothetical protein